MNRKINSNGKSNGNETNPFALLIPLKHEYTNEDYIEIQAKLKVLNIDPLLLEYYPKSHFGVDFIDIRNRCTRGIRQTLIDMENHAYPKSSLHKVGNGGDGMNCIVCCTSLGDSRQPLSSKILTSLKTAGYNGYFYLFSGGFPNPTGVEMQYVAVPYCFKIFMMLEAEKMGFSKVIWIDSACMAIQSPGRLFSVLDVQDSLFFSMDKGSAFYENVAFPKTIELLNEITGTDVRDARYVCTIVFGLNLGSPKIRGFIEEYYEMVKRGLPFLSTYPEEIVISAIFNKPEYQYLHYRNYESYRLFIGPDWDKSIRHEFYFDQLCH